MSDPSGPQRTLTSAGGGGEGETSRGDASQCSLGSLDRTSRAASISRDRPSSTVGLVRHIVLEGCVGVVVPEDYLP